MEACVKTIRIQGGPTHLKTLITSNPSQEYYYKIIKKSERIYQVEALHNTDSLANNDLTEFKGN